MLKAFECLTYIFGNELTETIWAEDAMAAISIFAARNQVHVNDVFACAHDA